MQLITIKVEVPEGVDKTEASAAAWHAAQAAVERLTRAQRVESTTANPGERR